MRPQYRTFDTKGAAVKWARQVEGAMDRGEWVDRTEGECTTLVQARERYEREILPDKAASGRDSEARRLKRLRERPARNPFPGRA